MPKKADGVKVFRKTKLLPRNAAVTHKPGGKKRSTTVITGEPVKRVKRAKENPVFNYRPDDPFQNLDNDSTYPWRKEKMMAGGVIKPRGYGIARGGRACKIS